MPLKKAFFFLSIQPHTFRICWIRDNASIQCPERAEEAIHYLFTLSANSDQLLQSPALSFFIKQTQWVSSCVAASCICLAEGFLGTGQEIKKKKSVECVPNIFFFLFRKLCKNIFVCILGDCISQAPVFRLKLVKTYRESWRGCYKCFLWLKLIPSSS